MANKKSVATWLKERLTDEDQGGKCVQFSMVHMTNGGSVRGKEVHTVKIGGSRQWTEKDMGETLQGIADSFSQELVVDQLFQIMAFYEGDKEPKSFFHLKGHAANGSEDGNNSFSPNAEGMRAQEMGMKGDLFKQMFQKQQQLDNTAMEMIRFLGSTVGELSHENREMTTMVKGMFMREIEQRETHEMAKMKYQRTSKLQETALKMVPVAVNRLSGKEIFPQSTEDTTLIEMMAENITEEQIGLIGMAMPPAVAGPLMARFQQYMKKKAAAEAVAEHAGRILSSADPEDDGAGG